MTETPGQDRQAALAFLASEWKARS
jgi:hypothetical protein